MTAAQVALAAALEAHGNPAVEEFEDAPKPIRPADPELVHLLEQALQAAKGGAIRNAQMFAEEANVRALVLIGVAE